MNSPAMQAFLKTRAEQMAAAADQPRPDLATMRAGADSMARPAPEDVTVTHVDAGGVPADWVVAPGADPARRILYLHGGGYVLLSALTHRRLAADISRASGCAALVLDYRLAPEHPFPAAVDDALAAYRWMLTNGPDGASAASASFIGGDSAGGGLTFATVLNARDSGAPAPSAAFSISAWTDVSNTRPSRQSRHGIDPLFVDPALLAGFQTQYMGDADLKQPLASPLFGDLAGFPPIHLVVADHEVLLDDTLEFADKARAAGVRTTVTVEPGGIHIYPQLDPELPESRAAILEIGAFLRSQG
ncbi:MAG: alpha/beta hydrolase [Chloroflexi bacterium]|nr:alpha/beta hydrolase [Chloroflexota bacterium]MDA1146316.1 alpha/beta hydrolase [Chloroflexota bacterium]